MPIFIIIKVDPPLRSPLINSSFPLTASFDIPEVQFHFIHVFDLSMVVTSLQQPLFAVPLVGVVERLHCITELKQGAGIFQSRDVC